MMPALTRRQLLAGAAATVAVAAMPAAVIAEQGFDLDRFIDVAVAETGALHPGTGSMMSAAQYRYELALAPSLKAS
jgi:hypothetical protein